MEKITAMNTEQYLSDRAAKARKSKFKAVLNKVPDVEPAIDDRF